MNIFFQENQKMLKPLSRRTESFLDHRTRSSQGSSRPGRISTSNPGKRVHLNSSRPSHLITPSNKDSFTPMTIGTNFPIQPSTVRNSRPLTAHIPNKQRVSSTKSKDKNRIIFNMAEEQKQIIFGPMVKKLYTPLNFRASVLSTRIIEKPITSERSPSNISNYLIGKEIGKGAYAIVRYAIHKATNRKVAIKIYDKSKFQDSNRLRNVHREIEILKKLNHSNVLKMYEAIETEMHLYLVLELVNGMSLNEYVKKHVERRLSENDACRIFYQIMLALEYCHGNDVAHRDIKFDNVLLDHSNNVKLIDFGFSTCMPKNQKTKTFCGTPSYMAPEIIKKNEYHGPPVDIWACGVVLYGMLCGYFPFKSHSDKECYKKILTGIVYIPSFVSFEPKELIEKILVLDPEKRPTAKEILSNPWLKRLRTMNFLADSSISSNTDIELNHSDSIFNQLVKNI